MLQYLCSSFRLTATGDSLCYVGQHSKNAEQLQPLRLVMHLAATLLKTWLWPLVAVFALPFVPC